MCNDTGLAFGERWLSAARIQGKRVLEVGSRQVQQPSISLRGPVTALQPREYVGVDLLPGPGVDVVCPAERLVEQFGPAAFDVVLSTEMLEHVADWRAVVSAMKRVCKPGGFLLLTTRSPGFPYHAWPHDHWRFERDDLRAVFADCVELAIESDPKEPGVFVWVQKPEGFVERTPELPVYSMVTRRRRRSVPRVRTFVFTTLFGLRRRYVQGVPRPLRNLVNRLLGRRPA
ncbi:MAG: class I SAM-dependent methyltransferase [Planctomycetes bacterium]|nr:class I SAM-dependent methyltransferase [Planctomycetota bacterium]